MQLTGSIMALQGPIGRLRKTLRVRWNFTSLHIWDNRSRSRRMLKLVCFVYLVDLVHLVSFIQPNKRNRPNKPNNGLLTLADFFSILLGEGIGKSDKRQTEVEA